MAYLAAMNAFSFVRLLLMGDREKEIEVRVPRTLMEVAM
jgi:hypothetical protein